MKAVKFNRLIWCVVILLSFTLITGCSSVKKLDIFSIEQERAKLNLDKPAPLTLEDIRWIIINSENSAEVFAELEKQGYDAVLFGLTDKDYQLLSKNFARIRAHLKESNTLLEKYKEYYEPEESKKTVDKSQ
jgi:hypothetical protein|tara:strand:+ start:6006 stop:6401 length:396 start_codon:yes stop_codon:yes gene_type:complete